MVIPFSCANCGRRFAVSDDRAGRTAKCPQCQASITIPELGRAPALLLPGEQSANNLFSVTDFKAIEEAASASRETPSVATPPAPRDNPEDSRMPKVGDRKHLLVGIGAACACVALGYIGGALTVRPDKVIVYEERDRLFSDDDTRGWIRLARLRLEESDPKYRIQRLLALLSQFANTDCEKSAIEELVSARQQHPDLYIKAVRDGGFYRLKNSASKVVFSGSGFGSLAEAEIAGEQLHAARIVDDDHQRIVECTRIAKRYPNTLVSRIAELDIALAKQVIEQFTERANAGE